MDIIRTIEKEVEEKCKSKNNIFGYGIWTHHILSVVKYSKMLAKKNRSRCRSGGNSSFIT
ncbi:hypothetical protein [Clostridium sp. OS1-26]|uniref:hypothetical protein n=1 Tax=Clostridium sp. OS1-26 TaxID=3070681 RepID=UPI0027E21453|nr:hypothetical protein [Clostridium sp. OS1-26]WML32991.1 hypothetical protein RCG18_16730 [Clostridium sp. OS1-26]